MAGWTIHEGQAVALPLESIDTDQLIPARFMAAPRAEGYGRFLLHDLRFDGEGATVPEMPLNRHAQASILVARRNFGSGSSREAAVYALVDHGVRAVIAPSFGDIFAANAINNGLLAAQMPEETVETMIAQLGAGTLPARIDLEAATISIGGATYPFDLDPVWRAKLMKGWDDIDLTASHLDRIAGFRDTRRNAQPWAWPAQ